MAGKSGRRKFPKLGPSKGHRVKKGQSSLCNPTVTKFREEAKNRLFGVGTSKGPGLTLQLLQQHDRASTPASTKGDASETLSVGGRSSASSYATLWSTCSNVSMNKFLEKWNPSSALHKEMLAVFGATSEIIRSRGGKETETEYFALLMTTLEAAETDVARAATASLLALVVNRVPPNVLRKEFSWIATMCINLLEAYADSEQVAFLRGLVGVLTAVLKVQEAAVWNESSTLRAFGTLFPFVTHPKPKVRRFAQRGICKVLHGSSIMVQQGAPAVHPAAPALARFCIRALEESSATAVPTSTLHLLGFLRSVLPTFSQSHVKAACEAVLHLMTVGHPMVVRCGTAAVHGLFSARPPAARLGAELNARLLNALYDYQPNVNDAKLLPGWLATMQEGLTNLKRLSEDLCLTNLPKFFGVAVNCWLSEKADLHVRVAGVLTALLRDCVQPCIGSEGVGTEPFGKVMGHLHRALQYQFHAAWAHTVFTWVTAFEVLGRKFHEELAETLRLLADLRDANKFSSTHLLDRAIGAAVKAAGPRAVLKAVPLKITGQNDDPEFPRSWLLPVLRDGVRETELAFFAEYFLPLANELHLAALREREANAALAKTYEILESQIWALLPGFCTAPTDVSPPVRSFAKVARTLGECLNTRPDLRLEVMSGLRLLVNTCTTEGDLAEVGRFAKNFLPILFNLYTQEPKGSQEEGVRLAVYETIKVYVKAADGKLCTSLFVKATEKLAAQETTTFNRHAILDLARALLSKMAAEDVESAFAIARANLESKDRTVQKKAYRVLEEICRATTDAGRSFVVSHLQQLQGLLLDSLQRTSPASRAPRLRCLHLLLGNLDSNHEDFALAVLREAVLCVRVNAKKVRQAAYLVVLEVGKALERWSSTPGAGVRKLMEQLVTGFAGSPYNISCTVLSLSAALHEFKGRYDAEVLNRTVEAVGLLMTSPSREVIDSSLYFVQMLFVLLETDELGVRLDDLVTRLCGLNPDCQKHFRIRLRNIFTKLVRKFGYETIAGMVPDSHRKLITSIRKAEVRKKKQKLRKEEEEEEASSEEEPIVTKAAGIDELLRESDEDELPDDDEARRKKGRRKQPLSAWIEERADAEIVDFLDPSACRKITSTNPKEEKNAKTQGDAGFKVSEDGKLIITEPGPSSQRKQDDVALGASAAESTSAAELLEAFAGFRRTGKRKRDEDDEDDPTTAAKDPRSSTTANKKQKREERDTGEEYRAKKARGDVRRKGKLEPYAYVPMNRKALGKRSKGRLQTTFKNLVKAAQKAAKKSRKKVTRTKRETEK